MSNMVFLAVKIAIHTKFEGIEGQIWLRVTESFKSEDVEGQI